jgi:hypothetical protein
MDNAKPRSPFLIIFSALILGIVLSVSVGGSFFLFGTSLKQVNQDSAVKIVAKHLPQIENQIDGISFTLLIETHTDEFDFYDVPTLSFLRVDGGSSQSAVKWTPSGKGHHIDGTIKFAQVLQEGPHNLQLIIKNIDGVKERILEWHITVKR